MSRALLFAAFFVGSLCAPFYSHAQEANVAPVITLLSIETDSPDPLYAQVGNTIFVVVETNEDIALPVVSINGTAVVMNQITTKHFEGEYVVTVDDPAGEVVLSVSVTDLLGLETVATTTTNGDLVVIGVADPLIADFTFEATNSAGSVFAYSIPEANAGMICTPASGSLFVVGETEITCAPEGGESTVIAVVTVTDTTAPVLTLVGDALVSLTEGDTYTELGASVTDNGDPAVLVVVGDAPNMNTAGTYAVTYTATDASGNTASTVRVVQVAAHSGGGGGGSSRRSSSSSDDGEVLGVSDEQPVATVADPSVEPEGEVLGASTYNFTRHLRQGDSGEDVTELQNLLARGGYFTETPTGYFGPVTAAALRAYQTANGLEAVGFVGPKTLVLLNTGTITKEARIQTLMVEIARIQEEIARLKNI